MESHEVSETAARPSKANILLVDDLPANLLALRVILADLGHDIVEAQSGEDALRRLSESEFAVVLMDVLMPGLDGFETAKRMRERKTPRPLPIIFLTAFDTSHSIIEGAYSLGAVDFLVKPLVPVIVRAKVASFIELFEKTQQILWQAEQIRQFEKQTFGRKLSVENARLRESEARKTAILQTALDCIITIDHLGRVIEFNPAAEQVFGYSKEDLQGRELAEYIIPTHLRESHRQGLAHLVATGEGTVLNQRIELPALRADGTEFPVELAIARISSDGPLLFTAYVRDISDRIRVERNRNIRLAVNQLLVQELSLSAAATGVLKIVCEALAWDFGSLWAVDHGTGTLTCGEIWYIASLAFTEFEATTRTRSFNKGEGLPGRVWADCKPAWIPDVTQDSNFPRAAVAAKEGLHGAFGCPIVIAGKTLGVIEFFSRRIQEPDADLLEMMATVAAQLGQFIERISAVDQLRQSEQRFAGFMQHLPGLAWIKDLNGCYVYANDEALKAFAKSREELYGKTDDEVFPAETAARFRENDRKAMSGNSAQVVETLEHDDGVLHYSLVSKFPIQGQQGRPILIGGMAIDITERVKAEESLKEINRLKDEFLATLAHELRNPLAPIRNSLQILKMPQLDLATIDHSREVMERQVQQLVRLVDDLLDVSRVMRGKIDLSKEPVELASIVARAVEMVEPLMQDQRHILSINLPDESLLLNADPVRLSQAVGNLLTNSAKYTQSGGRIDVTALRQGHQAQLRIRDNGIGIAPEMVSRIFDLFVQADHSTIRSQGGLGIGLTLVKNLVELHQGTVEIRSAGLGQGSEAVMTLPLLQQPPDKTNRAAVSAQQPSPKRTGYRLMVVDDNRDAATTLSMLLRSQGHEVQEAYDGATALKLATTFKPALIFLDIGMPSMDGYEVARRLRQQPDQCRTILVALTGWGQQDDRRQTADAGFNHHLVKPLDPNDLESLLAELGGNISQTDDHQTHNG